MKLTPLLTALALVCSLLTGGHVVAEGERTSAPARTVTDRAQSPQPQPARPVAARVQERAKTFAGNLAAPGGSQRWQCTEYDSGAVSCECKGMLDCKKLIDSGKCEGKSWWEDSNDPAIGGCDGSGP